MQLDSATGLYFDNARYYDSSTGRFISQDPTGFAGGNTNLNGYVNNDPINLVDPSGLSPKGHTGVNGGYQYSDEQLDGNYWFDNFVDDLLGPDTYGNAGQVTQPQWVDDVVEISSDVSQLAFTAASLFTGVGELEGAVEGVEAVEAEAQAINAESQAAELQNLADSQPLLDEAASINADTAAAEADDAAALQSLNAEAEAINGEAAEAEAVNGTADAAENQLPIDDQQLGDKFGSHMDANTPGYQTPQQYRDLANQIYNDPNATTTVLPNGETHMLSGNNLLRIAPDGTFRSLYPVGGQQ